MKVSRKGTVKLGRNDKRIGNFVFTREGGHIKVSDIGGITTWRVSVDTSVGWMLDEAIRSNKDKYLASYAAVMFEAMHTIPDTDYLTELVQICEKHIASHPEYYGKEAPADDKEKDDEILREEEQLQKEIDILSQP